MVTSINRIAEEASIDYDFLKREGFIQDNEDGYWNHFKLGIEYDYFTSRLNSKLWAQGRTHDFFVAVGFDQVLHYIQLILTYVLIFGK